MPAADSNARFWDRAARKYAASPIADAAGYERTLEETRRFLRPTDQALEVGCGTGTTALRLAASVAHITATDISSGMIAIAREKAAAQGCANVTFELATPAAPPGAPEAFDVVFGFNVLHLIRDRQAALGGVRRALKPGGLFISKTPCLTEMNPVIRFVVPVAQALGQAPYVAFLSPQELEDEIAAAGFEIAERARHGTRGNDARPFLVARKAD